MISSEWKKQTKGLAPVSLCLAISYEVAWSFHRVGFVGAQELWQVHVLDMGIVFGAEPEPDPGGRIASVISGYLGLQVKVMKQVRLAKAADKPPINPERADSYAMGY